MVSDKLFQPGNDNEWPFLGVYLEAQGQDDQRRRAVAKALTDVRSTLNGSVGRNWPFWRYVRPAVGAGSVDPSELACSGLQEFRHLWDAAAPIPDARR